jgi:hypothetical protein
MKTTVEWTAQAAVVLMILAGVVRPESWTSGDIACWATMSLLLSRQRDPPWLFSVKS